MQTLNKTINAHYDFELNYNIQRKIDYSICIPDTEIKGLVVYIAGFGADAGAYRNNFQEYICDDHSMACLTVDYHCFFSRPDNGANLSIDPNIMQLLRSITGCTNEESVDTVLLTLKKMNPNPKVPIKIPGTIYPKKNEYQNFGILPALDHIFAINDLFINHRDIPKKIYAVGSSYGGYIANIISKLAPCTLNAVFDNSSWADPNMKYIIGNGLGYAEFSCELEALQSPDIMLALNVVSPWSHLSFMPNAFNNNRQLIRSFPEKHLNIMTQTGNHKTVYRFVHSEKDDIANMEQKFSLANRMKKMGFNVQMKIYSEKDIDGKYIKNMNHGMDMSMKTFFSKNIIQTKNEIIDDQRIDFDFEHSFQFECETQNYIVTYSGNSQPVCSVS